MKKHMVMFALALMVMGVLLTATITYRVDEMRDVCLIKTFGRTSAEIRGSQPGMAGLKFKWPWPIQKLVRYDARTQIFEDTYETTQTQDSWNVIVTVYCAWRIKDAAKFHAQIEYVDEARDRIRTILRSSKKEAIGLRNMEDFVNTDPNMMLIARIEQDILVPVREEADKRYGVEIVSIGIKSIGLAEEVTTGVIDAMKEERQRDVKRYESAGDAQADAIIARAESARDRIISFAQLKASEIRNKGRLAAAKYYKEYQKNPELSMFLRSLESLKKELASKTTIILDGSRIPGVKFFRTAPSLEALRDGPGEGKVP